VAGTYNSADGAFHSKLLEDTLNPNTFYTDFTANVRASLNSDVSIGFATKYLCPAGIALDLNQGAYSMLLWRV
jgi:hypothetical protein